MLAQASGKGNTYALFLKPEGTNSEWLETGLWKDANALRGLRVMPDEGGKEARLFGVSTSGQCLLYDKDGKLQYDGGITSARGHSGDNVGRRSLTALLNGEAVSSAEMATVRVFGCSLWNEDLKDRMPA